jgi:hypothetical protein
MKKLFQSIGNKIHGTGSKAATILTDTRGELATNTIGSIIVAVVIIGLLIVAINAFFPNFFTNMFSKMTDKLNANW